jgi:integrase
MARDKLTATAVQAAKEPGRYSDGGGLYLWVREGGSKQWIVRVQKGGRRRDIGLGGFPKLSLAKARLRRDMVHAQVEDGLDPVAERKRAAGVPTFKAAAGSVWTEHERSWRNAKHGAQWLSSLEAYAFPAIGDRPLDKIDAGAVRDLVVPIWHDKPETARRVLQRVRVVLEWGAAKQYRPAVPALTPKALHMPKQGQSVVHHAAMPFEKVPAFVARLREREGVSRLALEALILTAARSGEIRGAIWSEIDLVAGLWTVPAARMKAGREHVVPLSPAAVVAFRRALPFRKSVAGKPDLVFPGMVKGNPLSDMALTKLLRDMGAGVTAHGFRSAFRDWAAERTAFPSEVAEMALAHTIQNKVEAAYRRGNLLEKRRGLMEAWGRYCTGDAGKVVRLAAGK